MDSRSFQSFVALLEMSSSNIVSRLSEGWLVVYLDDLSEIACFLVFMCIVDTNTSQQQHECRRGS